MEIHPPDHPVMTWKQFFIHMAIVVLGLLIAIWLEQTVEFLHHRYERKELIANNREECRDNAETTDNLVSYLAQETLLAHDWAALMEAAPVRDGSVTVAVPAGFRQREAQALLGFVRTQRVTPEMAVLATARESQTLQYLPTQTAQYFDWYEKVDEWGEGYIRSAAETKAEYDATMPGVVSLGVLPRANRVILSAATRDLAVQALRTWIAKLGYIRRQFAGLNIYFHATADGTLTGPDLRRWVQHQKTAK